MKRGLAFIGMLSAFLAAGCGADPWQNAVVRVTDLQKTASAKLDTLTQDVGKAIDTYRDKNKDKTSEVEVLKLDAAVQDCKAPGGLRRLSEGQAGHSEYAGDDIGGSEKVL